jgi:hypothetical protein
MLNSQNHENLEAAMDSNRSPKSESSSSQESMPQTLNLYEAYLKSSKAKERSQSQKSSKLLPVILKL